MTTFQAIVYGIIHGFSQFLPISVAAHDALVPYILGWPEPKGAMAGALAVGCFLSLLIYFRHDWLSMISCFLQVLIFRKKPMTLDERMPLFIGAAVFPVAASWTYVQGRLGSFEWSPLLIAASLAGTSLLIWFADSFSRRNKNLYDWNWLDALILGILQTTLLVPGSGAVDGAWVGSMFRNFNREAAAKFIFFTLAPLLAGSAFSHLHEVSFSSPTPMADMSWLSFCTAIVVSAGAGLLAIGGFMKHIQRKGIGQYMAYRLILATAVAIYAWVQSRQS